MPTPATTLPLAATAPRRGRPPTVLPTEQVVAAYCGGASIRVLAARHRVCPATVRRVLVGAGVSIRPRAEAVRAATVVNLAPAVLDAARTAYESGTAIGPLAVQHGVSVPVLRRALVADGVRLRTRAQANARRTAGSYDQIHADVREYATGTSITTLAERRGLCHATMRRLLVQAGATIRTPPRRPDLPVQDIAAAYTAGARVADLAVAHHVSAPTIARALRRAGPAWTTWWPPPGTWSPRT